MKNGNLTCSCCGAILERENYHEFEGKTYCTDCLNEKTVVCMNCAERIWREDAEGNSNLVLCRHCYDYSYTNCEDCGRLIHQEDANAALLLFAGEDIENISAHLGHASSDITSRV